MRIVNNPSLPTVEQRDESQNLMEQIGAAADEMKARDIVVLDVRGQTIVADFFVICAGTSNTHIKSIADGVQDRLRAAGKRAKPEGGADSFWMILDYSDVIVHIFDEGTREFYDLERLWSDAKISSWPGGDAHSTGQNAQTESGNVAAASDV